VKVLITGGAGFIGSHTADLLLKKGYEVRIIDSLEPPVHPQREKPDYLHSEIEFILGDVRNGDDLRRVLRGVSAVFHLAAYQGYLTDFSNFAWTNDGSTALLYEVIVNEHLPIEKVVLASSQAVYGEGKYKCRSHGIYYPLPRSIGQLERGEWELTCPVCHDTMESQVTDESKVNPHSQYATSKYSQELYALALGRRFGIPSVALRYSITQGPRQSYYNAYSGILRIFTSRIFNNLLPTVYEDGKQLRDYVHVKDVAEANVLALENNSVNFGAFNVGGTQAVTVLEYAKLIMSFLGKNEQLACRGEFRLGDTRHIVSDISKLGRLGWRPRIPLQEVIRDYLDWAQRQGAVSDHYSAAEEVMKRQGILRSVR
jgi:dTDP-L-rhamnose 4-epimerase